MKWSEAIALIAFFLMVVAIIYVVADCAIKVQP